MAVLMIRFITTNLRITGFFNENPDELLVGPSNFRQETGKHEIDVTRSNNSKLEGFKVPPTQKLCR